MCPYTGVFVSEGLTQASELKAWNQMRTLMKNNLTLETPFSHSDEHAQLRSPKSYSGGNFNLSSKTKVSQEISRSYEQFA